MIDNKSGLIVISVKIIGMIIEHNVRLAIDTGTTFTILRPGIIDYIGDNVKDRQKASVTTGTKTEYNCYFTTIKRIELFEGIGINNFKIVAKNLPNPLYMIDGLLGLDFFRFIKKKLCIDFKKNSIEID